jgi:hypothetical protein
MIVVDNRLAKRKTSYYRRACEAGSRVVLIHLADEQYSDDMENYKWCDAVFRNYYSPLVAGTRRVQTFALGYKSGFVTNKPPLPFADRTFVWSFAGDASKSTRPAMLTALRQIAGGQEHLTTGFNTADALPIGEYRQLMDDSVFVPCPTGNVNLDSFRVYEALEAGCVPIVERRTGYDYFSELYGCHPFPSVLDWNEAASLIRHLCRHNAVQHLMDACQVWWAAYKRALSAKIRDAVVESRL